MVNAIPAIIQIRFISGQMLRRLRGASSALFDCQDAEDD
jgi:hypothetical protein